MPQVARDAASPRLHEQAVAGDNGTHSKLKTQGPVRTIESAGAGLATEVWQRASPSQRFAYTARSCWMHAGPPCCTGPTGFFAVSDAMDRSTAPLVHPRRHPLHLHSYAATKRQFILHAHGRARGGQADAHFQAGNGCVEEVVSAGGVRFLRCYLLLRFFPFHTTAASQRRIVPKHRSHKNHPHACMII